MYNKLFATLFSFSIISVSASASSVTTPQRPVGFGIGGDIGYGYLMSHEANNLNDLAPTLTLSNRIRPRAAKNFRNGHLAWGAHAQYDFAITEQFLAGVEAGYKSLGQSSGWTKSYSYSITSDPTLYSTTINSYSYIMRQQAIDFLLTGKLYISQRWPGLNLGGKVGAAWVNAHDSVNFMTSFTQPFISLANPGGSYVAQNYQSVAFWRLEPEVGLNAGYSFTSGYLRGINAYVAYTYIGGTDGNTATSGSATNYNTPWQAIFAYNGFTAGFDYHFA